MTAEIDNLTGIHNDTYLNNHYHDFINEYPNSRLIMIDFKKFKKINDTFGHTIGDAYIILFAKILTDVFQNKDIVVRLHGDEFAILTQEENEVIERKFFDCDRKIRDATKKGIIPKIFSFNAGSSNTLENIDETISRADYMMYHAKKRNLKFQEYLDMIWEEKKEEIAFLKKIDSLFQNHAFCYTNRNLYELNGNMTNIMLIHTKDKDLHSLFEEDNF